MKKPRKAKAPAVQHCQAPDRDVPKLTCGYPLPCPWHNFRRVVRIGVIIPEKSASRKVRTDA